MSECIIKPTKGPVVGLARREQWQIALVCCAIGRHFPWLHRIILVLLGHRIETDSDRYLVTRSSVGSEPAT